ncbi:glutamate--tRNA ligase [Candidatus Pacearchaeota archaeon CG1_02_32_132]|nr:MAG: glutamate--tRNA ligase [Candidatus Pacearchaeota archaeon CG1_02_32_132]
MKPFEKEIIAYALQNALKFGKADAGKILPKLFQHGLKREDIGGVMPLISEIVKKVNSMNDKERLKELENFEGIARKKVFETKGLPALKQSEVSGKMTFRLAPFPSGALHIGNAKTYLLNALYAEEYDADLLLVIDDTIGSVEKQADKESYDLIEDGFKWLGVNYKKPVIYKSDRLEIYYKYAKELIEKNKAYVCYCIQEELRENRAKGVECSCRQFPPGIQLERWKEMFNAKEGQAVMRIKTNMTDPNPAFRDRVLFKISDREHPRVGKKYRVWPTLEMSWAIDDHLLKITHILRGNELMIETKMEKYIWDIFKWKHPEVIHVGIVKLEGLVGKISKSKSTKEVKSGVYTGWDDPRTWSIQSLIRRGILKESIREFVKEIGLNRQDITVPIDSLYAINRKTLDAGTNRYFFVANPVKIEIENNLGLKEAKLPLHPDKKDMRTVKVGKKIFVSGEDWEKLKGKEVRLLHLFNLTLDEKTKITSIENKNIPKIHWVSDKVDARVLMPDGKWIEGFADSGIEHLRKYEVIQFERFGFVRYDGTKKGVKEFWFAHR